MVTLASDCKDLDAAYYCFKDQQTLERGNICDIVEIFDLKVSSDKVTFKSWGAKLNIFSLPLNGNVQESMDGDAKITESIICEKNQLKHDYLMNYFEQETRILENFSLKEKTLTIFQDGSEDNSSLNHHRKFSGVAHLCKKVPRGKAMIQFNTVTSWISLLTQICGKVH